MDGEGGTSAFLVCNNLTLAFATGVQKGHFFLGPVFLVRGWCSEEKESITSNMTTVSYETCPTSGTIECLKYLCLHDTSRTKHGQRFV
jgi:hypothetical protein